MTPTVYSCIRRESNPSQLLGRQLSYRWTTEAMNVKARTLTILIQFHRPWPSCYVQKLFAQSVSPRLKLSNVATFDIKLQTELGCRELIVGSMLVYSRLEPPFIYNTRLQHRSEVVEAPYYAKGSSLRYC
jgi:hypothetical protein